MIDNPTWKYLKRNEAGEKSDEAYDNDDDDDWK